MMHVGRRLGLASCSARPCSRSSPGFPTPLPLPSRQRGVGARAGRDASPLRTPDGERELQTGRRGRVPARSRRAAHALANNSGPSCAASPIFSSMRHPDVVAVPGSAEWSARIAGDAPTAGRDAPFEAFFRPPTGIDYGDIGQRVASSHVAEGAGRSPPRSSLAESPVGMGMWSTQRRAAAGRICTRVVHRSQTGPDPRPLFPIRNWAGVAGSSSCSIDPLTPHGAKGALPITHTRAVFDQRVRGASQTARSS